jgi:hypothetical protein
MGGPSGLPFFLVPGLFVLFVRLLFVSTIAFSGMADAERHWGAYSIDQGV